nr:hypothetical protein [Candidatus Sigynarchaeota archaeon]
MDQDTLNEALFSGFLFATALMGVSLALYGPVCAILSKNKSNKGLDISIFLITLAAIIVSSIVFATIAESSYSSEDEIRYVLYGMGVGFLVAALEIMLCILFTVFDYPAIVEKVVTSLSVIAAIVSIISNLFVLGTGDQIATIISEGLDAVAVFIGVFSIAVLAQDVEVKFIRTGIFCIASLILSIVFLSEGAIYPILKPE